MRPISVLRGRAPLFYVPLRAPEVEGQISFKSAKALQLADGQLDAGFFLTGLGAPVIQEAQKRGQISLAAVAIGGNENESPY